MKTIELDEELYRYIASHTQHIGESASDILRRMLKFTAGQPVTDLSVSGAAVKVTAQPAPRDRVRAVRELLLSDEYAEQSRAVNRFMLVLSTLYTLDAQAFTEATESLHGRTRVYFAGDQQTLLQHGTHTNPSMCQVRHSGLSPIPILSVSAVWYSTSCWQCSSRRS